MIVQTDSRVLQCKFYKLASLLFMVYCVLSFFSLPLSESHLLCSVVILFDGWNKSNTNQTRCWHLFTINLKSNTENRGMRTLRTTLSLTDNVDSLVFARFMEKATPNVTSVLSIDYFMRRILLHLQNESKRFQSNSDFVLRCCREDEKYNDFCRHVIEKAALEFHKWAFDRLFFLTRPTIVLCLLLSYVLYLTSYIWSCQGIIWEIEDCVLTICHFSFSVCCYKCWRGFVSCVRSLSVCVNKLEWISVFNTNK